MNPQAVIPKVYPFKMESILNVKTKKVEAADYWLCQGKAILQKLEVSLTEKRKQYACPCCKTPLILKMGKRRLHYFAHPMIEDAASCKICTSKVKTKKVSEIQPTVSEKQETSNPDEKQELNSKARIIAFYPDNNNWDSTLGVSEINYFVTPNNFTETENSENNDPLQKYNDFDDTILESPSTFPSSNDIEHSFEFLTDQSEYQEEESDYPYQEEELNIEWLLKQFNGSIPKDYMVIQDKDLVKLVFQQKLSRSINNLRTRILDLKIAGFNFPENILDIMSDKGLIKRLEETSQIQFERAS